MKGSFRIARAFGIDIRVHVTFFLILVWGALAGANAGAIGMVYGVLFIALLFVCVVLHELGHSVVALRFGIPVRDITLLPIGGVASLGRSPEKPIQELLIAVAGPAVNVVIAIGLAALLGATGTFPRTQEQVAALFEGGPTAHRMLVQLLSANIVLVLFNMIPAFPLDGGRVLRAVLAMMLPRARATRIAASIGQLFAVGLGIFGAMTGQWMLLLVAVFVFFAAGAETAQAMAHNVLQTRRVGDAYNRSAVALTLDDRVSRVVDLIFNSYQPDFAVVHRGQLQGIVTREDVLRWLAANAYDVYVTEVMNERVPHVQAHQTLDEVRTGLAEANQRVAAVYEGPTFLGLVSTEDIDEAMTVLSFLQRTVPPGAAPGPRSIAAAVQGVVVPPPLPPEAGVLGDSTRG